MKPFWSRLALLALVVTGGQILVGPLWADPDYPGRTVLEKHLRRPVEVLYFGDSVLDWKAQGDADPRGIPAMLRDRLPLRAIGDVSNQAFDLDLYDALIARVSRSARPPATIVIPINLRTFSPVWDMAPPFQFRSVKFRLHYGDFAADTLLRPLSALKLYSLNPISDRQFRSTPLRRGDRKTGVVGDFISPIPWSEVDRRITDIFVMNYLHPLRENHRKLASLRSIVRRCRRVGIRPVFYVTPVDMESGTRRIGAEFRETVARHISIIRGSLQESGLPLLDLAGDLDASHFDWPDAASPNEHLRETGRRQVAERLARVLAP